MPEFFEVREPALFERFGREQYEKKTENICELWKQLYKFLDENIKDERIRESAFEYIVEGYYMGQRMFNSIRKYQKAEYK
jgi:hypothetical protein